MKKYFLFKIILVVILLIITSCDVIVEKKNSQVPELINFLQINKNDKNIFQIEDIFFAKNYEIKFQSNKDLQVSFDKTEKQIKLKPNNNFSGLTFLHFTNNNIPKVIPVIVKQKVAIDIKFKLTKPSKKVFVMGSFNTWLRNSNQLLDKNNDGIYTTQLLLDDGVYEYQFVTDYGETPDPANPEKVDNGFGSFNSILKVQSEFKAESPKIFFLQNKDDYKIKFHISSKHKTDDIQIHILEDNELLKNNYYNIKNNTICINTKYLSEYSNIKVFRLIATYNNYPGNIITVWTKNGKILASNEFIWQDAVIYSLMTDRFSNGNSTNDNPIKHERLADQANFQGGDFQGIIDKIQSMYFKKIGVNTIWISPINKTTNKAFQEWPEPRRYFSGYHGYWPTSSTETEPNFGTMEEFKKLVQIAKKHNIKILLDFVSNHTHIDHTYFKNHRDWYGTLELDNNRKNIRLFNDYRLTTWFDTFLPSFDFINSEEATQTMSDNAIWWINETGIDGFRHDATKHVPLKFWRLLTKKIKTQIDPQRSTEFFQIGETFGSAQLIKSYVNNGMLDSQFNFELFFTQRRVFANETGDFRDVKMSLDKSLEVYGYNHLMGNILDSHDQVRMMSLLEGDLTLSDNGTERAWDEKKIHVDEQSTYEKQQALMAFVLAVPGIPIIYYGDEFGMTGANDPDNRRMMRFDNKLNDAEKNQLKWNSKIINLRKKHSSLRRGDYLPIYCDENVMIFSRGDKKERLIIAINKSGKKQTINLDLPIWIKVKEFDDLLVKNSSILNGQMILSAYSGNIWKCKF